MDNLFIALFQQVFGNPACMLIILPISIMAFVLEVWPMFPSKLVLPVCLLGGSTLFPALVRTSTVPPIYPNPLLVLILNGFIVGFIAWIFHKAIIKRLIKKFANGLSLLVEHEPTKDGTKEKLTIQQDEDDKTK